MPALHRPTRYRPASSLLSASIVFVPPPLHPLPRPNKVKGIHSIPSHSFPSLPSLPLPSNQTDVRSKICYPVFGPRVLWGNRNRQLPTRKTINYGLSNFICSLSNFSYEKDRGGAGRSTMAELPAAATVGHRKRRREDIEPHIDLAEDEHNQKQETKSKHKCHCHMYFDVMPLMEKEYIQKIGKENCYVSPALVKAILDEQSRPLANVALEYYNKKQGVNFVCLDPMLSNDLSGAWDDGDVGWFHANFKAHDPGSADPSEKLFFAEVYVSEGRKCKGFTVDHVKTVQVLDISDPGVVKGCRYCRHIYHPEGGYKAGVVPKGWTPPGEGSTHGEQCFEGHADLEFVVEFD